MAGYTSKANDTNQRHYSQADDDYLQLIEQYKGSPYYDQMLNNPWLFKNQGEFSPNFFQSIGEIFGDFSARDKYYSGLVDKRNQFLSDLVAQYNQYNLSKPAVNVALDRQAGLNPDLTGVQGAQPTENDQPQLAPEMPNSPSDSVAPTIMSAGMSLIQSLFNMGQSLQEFQLKDMEIASKDIQNHKGAMDYVIESIAKAAPFKDSNEIDDASIEALSDYVLKAASKADYSGYSRHTRKIIKRMFSQYDRMLKDGKDSLGVAALKAQLRNQFVQNQTGASRGASSLIFDESFVKMTKNIADVFSQLEYDLEKLNLEADISSAKERKAENGYNTSYFHYASGQKLYKSEVDAQTEGYEAQRKAYEADKLINDTWDRVISYLKGDDQWYNALGVILATYLRSQTFHLPNISISGPKSTVNNTDRREQYDKKVVIQN